MDIFPHSCITELPVSHAFPLLVQIDMRAVTSSWTHSGAACSKRSPSAPDAGLHGCVHGWVVTLGLLSRRSWEKMWRRHPGWNHGC